MTPNQYYQQRRNRLIQTMQHGIAIIPTAIEKHRNADTHYPYRFDSSFYYLTGFTEPEAVLVLIAGERTKHILFCRDKDPEREIWDGFRYGPHAAREEFGFDEAYSIKQLDELIPTLLANQPKLHFALGVNPHWDRRVLNWLNQVRAQARIGVAAPSETNDIRQSIAEMRLFKDADELGLMRQAAQISSQAHQRAMGATQPGKWEYQIEAELLHEFRRSGSASPAYPSIVAGGKNACVLHYVENTALLQEGDLLLIDAGCEFEGYASDITRTFPVNGRFSGPQKEIYQLVLAAQAAAIALAKPGCHWNEPHEAAIKVLAQGMVDLKLCQGSVESVLEQETYKQFYMHRTGHWLGLDVHDAGDYKLKGEWRPFEPGMTLTVEPGCYIRPAEGVPEAFWHIGIRIEDDVLITETGNEVLTIEAPKTVQAIEALMNG